MPEPKSVIVIRDGKSVVLVANYTAANLKHAKAYGKNAKLKVEVHKLAASFRHNP